jgi:tRNA nucleotidyltransferase (CCA-adding enzyme)
MKVDPVRVRRERVRLGDDMLHKLYLMRMCDLSGKGNKNMKFLDNVGRLEGIRRSAAADAVPASVKDLQINGHDVSGICDMDGAEVGRILRAVLDEVVCQPNDLKRTRDWQLQRAFAMAGK